jgi:hypothetical protein
VSEPMLALTTVQPWATHIAYSTKGVENRTWAAPKHLIGHTIAIHAGAKKTADRHDTDLPTPLGAVLGTARLARVISSYDEAAAIEQASWWIGPFGFVLDERRVLVRESGEKLVINPIACKGALGFWRLPTDVDAAVRASAWLTNEHVVTRYAALLAARAAEVTC